MHTPGARLDEANRAGALSDGYLVPLARVRRRLAMGMSLLRRAVA